MRKQRDWFWQIKEMGQGPDYIFIAIFGPSDARRLASLVHHHLPVGFVHSTIFYDVEQCAKYSIYEKYVDKHTYSRFVENQKRSKPESIWYYGEITVHDHQFVIQHNNAGGMYDDAELVRAIAQSPDLALQEWKVVYSGNSWGEVAKGTTAEELLEYLHWKELPDKKPDFEQIRTELQKAMSEPEISEVFELGEFLVGDWLCQALMLWKIHPYPNALSLLKTFVVEPVSHKCQVPGNSRRGAAPALDSSPIAANGEYIQFGYAHWSGHDHEDEFKAY